MTKDVPPFLRLATLALRISLALSFLSAVADRFGLWGPPGAANVAWGSFGAFLQYTALLLAFLPAGLIPAFGWIATGLEIALAIGLLVSWRLRWFALGSALLLFSFGVSMTLALGLEPAFSYSVWTACASAFVLAGLDDRKPAASDAE
ncbi:MAG: DoxX family protein [Verrucomicrobiota bacterium]